MKNIAFIIESLQCGGAEKSLVTLLNLLDYKKFNVDLILFRKNGEFEKFVPKEIKINYILNKKQKKTNFFNRLIFWFLKKTNKGKKHISQIHWSVFKNTVSIHDKTYDIAIAYNQGFATYYVAEKINAKTKFAWLNTDYKNAGYNMQFDYKYYKCYNKIICVSKESEISIKNEVEKIGQKLKTDVIKDISDLEFITKMSHENSGLNDHDKYKKILTVGRLAKAKGYSLAIESLLILKSKGYQIKWYVIGEGPQRNEIENLIKEKGLVEDFLLLGYKENPYPYIKSCDIYAQPSLFEGLGLTVIEASILQKPIVTTNFPTAYSIIENERTGLICEMNPISISDAIEKYLMNDDLKNMVTKNLSLLKNNDKEISLNKVNQLLSH